MTETESKWSARVDEWRGSGKSAREFSQGKGFSAGGLRYWASRLGKGSQGARSRQARLARVVCAPKPAPVTETPIMVEVGGARLGIRRGFDPGVLRSVLDVLGGGR
jgi:hypothetical protein